MSAQKTYPIVLAHGIARFDALREFFVNDPKNPLSKFLRSVLSFFSGGSVPDHLHYFRNIRSSLEKNGFTVRQTNVAFADSLERRANDLKAAVNKILSETGAKKVHIIAHSMGGLDSRYMIAKLGMAERVASLTTIGTPHLGSSFADSKLTEKKAALLKRLDRLIHAGGVANLTNEACLAFDREVQAAEAANDVFYQTYSSWQEHDQVLGILQPSWDVIHDAEKDGEHMGRNDGLVGVASQKWKPQLVGDGGAVKKVEQKEFPIQADHLNECGWWDLNERLGTRDKLEGAVKQVYLDIANDLRQRFPA